MTYCLLEIVNGDYADAVIEECKRINSVEKENDNNGRFLYTKVLSLKENANINGESKEAGHKYIVVEINRFDVEIPALVVEHIPPEAVFSSQLTKHWGEWDGKQDKHYIVRIFNDMPYDSIVEFEKACSVDKL